MNIISGELIECLPSPLTYISGWIMLFLCSYVLHLLIREPILNWAAKKDKGQ